MATNFPTGLDSFTDPAATDTQDSPSHSGQHKDKNDALEAVEAKVGVNGSAVTTSLDYQMENHQHTAGADDGGTVSHDDLSGVSVDDHHNKVHTHLNAGEGGTVSHDDLTGVSIDDHHARDHDQGTHDRAEAGDLVAVGTSADAGTSLEVPNADHRHAHEPGHLAHDTLADAKGDVFAATAADTIARLAVGTDGDVLTADAASTPGVKWAAPAGGAPSGAAGGDLSGTYPNPSVVDDSHSHSHDTTITGVSANDHHNQAHDKDDHTDRTRHIWLGPENFKQTGAVRGSSGAFTPATSTFTEMDRWEFADAAQLGIIATFAVPEDWVSGAIQAEIFWAPGSTNTGNCRFLTEALSLASGGDTVAAAATEGVHLQAGVGTTAQLQKTTAADCVTPANAGDLVRLIVWRNGTAGTDTFTGLARLHGVRLSYTADM